MESGTYSVKREQIFQIKEISVKNGEWLLNLAMRSILGTIAMYFVNGALASMGLALQVGINVYTVLTTGILGVPGLLALYGIGLYRIL